MTPRIRVSTISGAQQHGSRRVTSAMLAVVVTLGVYVAVLASPAAPAGPIRSFLPSPAQTLRAPSPANRSAPATGDDSPVIRPRHLTHSGDLPPTFAFTDDGRRHGDHRRESSLPTPTSARTPR